MFSTICCGSKTLLYAWAKYSSLRLFYLWMPVLSLVTFRLNGVNPPTISQRRIPTDQMSAFFASYPPDCGPLDCNITSGAVYPGVPQLVKHRWEDFVSCLLNPKSISLMWPAASRRMFSGFKSLYTMFWPKVDEKSFSYREDSQSLKWSRPCRISIEGPLKWIATSWWDGWVPHLVNTPEAGKDSVHLKMFRLYARSMVYCSAA